MQDIGVVAKNATYGGAVGYRGGIKTSRRTVGKGGAGGLETCVIREGAYVQSGPCRRLERHHLIIWTDCTDWWTEKNTHTLK